MPAENPSRRFPDGFLFGTKTSAYQVEGAVDADGRGSSIWDTFSHTPGKTRNGDTGDVTSDQYHRLDQDLELIGELGAPGHCFSVAWPRVQPDGQGPPNQRGLDFYRRMVDGLRQRGVIPVATLYHWDLPEALQQAGGWTARDTAMRFADYAGIVGEALADGMGMWVTHTEPWCAAWLGNALGIHAPGLQDLGTAVAATHHLLLSHGEAARALRAAVPGCPVGIDLNLQVVRAASDHPEDRAAARRSDGNSNRLFLDPLLLGSYPGDMLEHYAERRPGFSVIRDGDLGVIAQPLDFLGVNYYSPKLVCAPTRMAAARTAGYWVPRTPPDDLISGDLGVVDIRRPEVEVTPMGWEVDPGGLTELLIRLRTEYGPRPIHVLENGRAADDYVDPAGEVQDLARIEYLRGHLHAVLDAIDAGVDVRGYFVWSLLDNFEWGQGFSMRFGLTWVDYPSGARIPKTSFGWYREVVKAGALPIGPG
ncbi:MAG: family 1 glycosylhydrolase [Candidatus Dormiibacterota bacterium]